MQNITKQGIAAIIVMVIAILMTASLVYGTTVASYTVKRGDTLFKIARANHISLDVVVKLNPQIKNINWIYPGEVIKLSSDSTPVPPTPTPVPPVTPPVPPTPSPVPPPPPVTPPVTPPSTGGSITLTNVFITGYADGDNTPPGVPDVDLDGHHGVAGGDCTYANPTTMAVGHVITNGNDKGDFAYGTKFYVADMKGGPCYFVAQDTCGDGNTPQNGACHKPEEGSLQLDAYVGHNGSASCEESMTTQHTVIQNPPAGLAAVAHNICNN